MSVAPSLINGKLLFCKNGQQLFNTFRLGLTANAFYRCLMEHTHGAIRLAYQLFPHKQIKYPVPNKSKSQWAERLRITGFIK